MSAVVRATPSPTAGRRAGAGLAGLAVLLCAALAAPAAAAATPPSAFSADYEVLQNGKPIGRGSISLRDLGGGRFELVTRSEGTQGLAAVAGVKREERSLLAWTGAALETREYRMQQKAAWNSREHRVQVDPSTRRITSTWKGEATPLPWRAGVLERHGATAAMMSALASGRETGTITFPIVGRRDLEDETYRFAARVRLRTAVGTLRAVRVERVREAGDGRVTKLWFARDRGWLPLRIKQYEADGETLDMRIVAIRQ